MNTRTLRHFHLADMFMAEMVKCLSPIPEVGGSNPCEAYEYGMVGKLTNVHEFDGFYPGFFFWTHIF